MMELFVANRSSAHEKAIKTIIEMTKAVTLKDEIKFLFEIILIVIERMKSEKIIKFVISQWRVWESFEEIWKL